MAAKMQGWKNHLLSHAGREVLIKAIVQAIPSYAMACFFFPQNFCQKMDAFIRNYWWKGDPGERGIHWEKWTSMCMSKHEGGMGFRNFSHFNQALLARQGWRLINSPNSSWARMFKGIYYPHSDFLQAARGARASWAWSSLLKGRELLLKGCRWQIHNGLSVRFWDDRRIPTLTNFKVSSLQPPGSGIVTVSDAIDPVTKLWKVAVLRTLVSGLETVPFIDKADTLVWHHTKSGTYSVKSGYHLSRKSSDKHLSRQPSSSFFFEVFGDKFGTCKSPSKSATFGGDPARMSWQQRQIWRNVVTGKETLSQSALIGWYIWKIRNDFIFNSVPVNPSDTLQKIHHGWNEYFLQGGEETIAALADNSMAVGSASGWTPPLVGTIKVNCDASFHRSSAKASAAAIMRDSEGHFIDRVVTSFFSASAPQAEAVAVRLACRLVQMYGLSLADIENDNQELIHLCVSETVPPWEIKVAVADIRSLARDRAWKLLWTRRTNNSAAHWVATADYRSSLPASWVTSVPLEFASVLSHDESAHL
ncbi:uncharacterized protein LOC114319198 [Camellia sinensis]|uniref:uncharacterized protein LOC114319198 n=1 Tax=Camellia sinensis TaxID=4442 RepID=UPI001035CB58|nr:uncharacterized protein LOC114319198 [Camellia sinensis]